MNKNRLYIFLFSICLGIVKAQDKNAFNEIYTKTYLETSLKDFDKALYIADSLYNISGTPYYKTKSLMLSATLYQQKGELKKSVEYALKADQIIEETDDYVWRARTSGFLATQYRILKLYEKSQKYSKKALETSKKIENPEMGNSTMGLMMQEMAYYETEKKNYRKSIDYLNESLKYFSQIIQNKDALIVNSEQLLGLNYYKMKDYEHSLFHYQKALKYLEKMPPHMTSGLVYDGLANVYIEKNNPEKAKEYIELAEKISGGSEYLLLKNEINTTRKKYYFLTQNQDSLKKVEEKAEEISEKISENITSFIDEDYSKLEKKNTEVEEKNVQKNILIMIGAVLILALLLWFLYYRRKQNENISAFKEILNKLKEEAEEKEQRIKILTGNYQKENGHKTDNLTNSLMNKVSEQEGLMTLQTEQKLLAKLEEFEESDLYLSRNISLPFLASHFETNIKYLSHILSTHRKKAFNNYINDLRIKYIIKKLNNEPLYRQYKIAVLAEEAGFSSPNKFATIFKSITTLSPSLFIKYLEKGIGNQ